MLNRCRALFATLAVFIFWASVIPAQQAAPVAPREETVRTHYTKFEFRIPMRDGVRLFTVVYAPKDAEGGPYPFLINRTPYDVGPYGEDKYPMHLGSSSSDEFEQSGYIFVNQDVRARWMSEGEYVEMRPHIDEKKSPKDVDDSSDMSDTLDFLLKHVANNNGKAGIYGISYPGFYTSASIIDSHPALVAASPQAPMPDLFHTFRRGHRIMVQVQSSWFPLTDRNPQTFTDIPNARPEEFQKATERVYRQKDAPSGVEVLVMP